MRGSNEFLGIAARRNREFGDTVALRARRPGGCGETGHRDVADLDCGAYPGGFRIGIRCGVGSAGSAVTRGNGQIIGIAGLVHHLDVLHGKTHS